MSLPFLLLTTIAIRDKAQVWYLCWITGTGVNSVSKWYPGDTGLHGREHRINLSTWQALWGQRQIIENAHWGSVYDWGAKLWHPGVWENKPDTSMASLGIAESLWASQSRQLHMSERRLSWKRPVLSPILTPSELVIRALCLTMSATRLPEHYSGWHQKLYEWSPMDWEHGSQFLF